MAVSASVARQRLDGSNLTVMLARHQDEVEAAQRLRYQIFSEEFGAHLPDQAGLDRDAYDDFCEHLLVKNQVTGQVVGTYRLLTPEQARAMGGYYAEGEFDLKRFLCQPARFLEIGRSCVHADFRSGVAIALLWSGIADCIRHWQIDFLIGCASVPNECGEQIGALYRQLTPHLLPYEQRCSPRRPLPAFNPVSTAPAAEVPSLLKGYLRAGAQIGGEPAWDPDFRSADFFMCLDAAKVSPRYRRHFMAM